MRNLTLLIKPASGNCNLRCTYCFYNDVAENRLVKYYGMMSHETAEVIIQRALVEAKQVSFCFQGGEPTLWGLDNFRFFTETVDRLKTNRVAINYAMQTNGVLLNESWAAFLNEHHFLVGLSLDGYKELHDLHRPDSYNRVLKAASLLKKAGVEFNILSVVTSETAGHTDKVYRFFQRQGFQYLQFIPCIDDFEHNETNLTVAQYGQFLNSLFSLWYRDCIAGHGISIRYFDNILSMYAGYPPEQCSMNGVCNIQFTIEADGSVYPCDFYVLDHWRLGNVHTDSFQSMLTSDTAKWFIAESASIQEECTNCRWLRICRGGCKRDKEPIPSSNRFCQTYKTFFEDSHERFIELRQIIASKPLNPVSFHI